MDLALKLNQLEPRAAEKALASCCAARAWVTQMLERRPFPSRDAVFAAASAVWAELGRDDYLEAFLGHPKIGEDIASLRARFAQTAHWSGAEQAGVAGASERLLEELRQQNQRYEQRFGYIFIVCASGKTAAEMLALLKARLLHTLDHELAVAAAEQAKITRLRLEKLEASAPPPGEEPA